MEQPGFNVGTHHDESPAQAYRHAQVEQDMGTDILMYLERRISEGWQFAGLMEENTQPLTEAEEIEPAIRPVPLYSLRNSALFAILGNPWENPAWSTEYYEVIAPLRGLPPDLSPELRTWSGYWYYEDTIRGSWLQPQELLTFDWTKTLRKRAMVDKRVAHLFGNGRRQFPHKRWTSHIPVSYATYMRDGREVTWVETYAESAGIVFMETVETALRHERDPGSVRVVFWFH
jgi:hypothetical protein